MIASIAIIWDFDGVVVFTPHEKAWELAAEKLGVTGFTSEFYRSLVSGRPRLEGARNIVKYLHGEDAPERLEELARKLAEVKNDIFLSLVEQGEVELNSEVLDFIARTRVHPRVRFLNILASASKNASRIAEVLSYGGNPLKMYFDVDVSGSGATKRDVFANALAASAEADCHLAVDDAQSGIRAAVELGIIPIGYGDPRLALHGAELVVESLKSLDPEVFVRICGSR
ncbi:MAG: HAD family phosphatase [Infirmifilum sp.]